MKTYSTATHWGAYNVETDNDRIVSMHPFSADPDPSQIGLGMPQAIHDRVRIEQLAHGRLPHKNIFP